MAGGSVSWLVVLVGIAGYAVGNRYHAVGYSGYYPGYVRQDYTPGQDTTSQDRSENLSTFSAEEVSKPKIVNQSVDIRQNGEGLSETVKDKSDKNDNHKIVVNQSVHQNIDHYHILADTGKHTAEEVHNEEIQTQDKVATEDEDQTGTNPSIAFNIWGNNEVHIRQEGDRVYNTYRGDTVYNYGGLEQENSRIATYGGFGKDDDRVARYGGASEKFVYSDYPNNYYDYGYYYDY